MNRHILLTVLLVAFASCSPWKHIYYPDSKGVARTENADFIKYGDGITGGNTDGSKNIYLVDSIKVDLDSCLMIEDNYDYLFIVAPTNLLKIKSRDFLQLDDTYILQEAEHILSNDDIFPLASKIIQRTKRFSLPGEMLRIRPHWLKWNKYWGIGRYWTGTQPDLFYIFLVRADLFNYHQTSERPTRKERKKELIHFKEPMGYYRVAVPVWNNLDEKRKMIE